MRKSPLNPNPDKIRAWKERSRQKQLEKQRLASKVFSFNEKKSKPPKRCGLKRQRSTKRSREEAIYNRDRLDFLRSHPFCPVTGGQSTQIHHAARRHGKWLNLKRHWIAVSADGHRWIEDNGGDAKKLRLICRIYLTYDDYCAKLQQAGIDLDKPVYYYPDDFDSKLSLNEKSNHKEYIQ